MRLRNEVLSYIDDSGMGVSLAAATKYPQGCSPHTNILNNASKKAGEKERVMVSPLFRLLPFWLDE